MSKKQLLIALIGESGSGKSSIASRLNSEGIEEITSHTTRPRRKPSENYIFSTKEDFEVSFLEGQVLEHTKVGEYIYWTCHEDFDYEGIKTIVVNVEGLEHLREKLPENIHLVTIHVKSDYSDRYRRLMDDYWYNQPDPPEFYHKGHAEDAVTDRMMRDLHCFDLIPCNYVVDNAESFEHTMDLVRQVITKEKGRT